MCTYLVQLLSLMDSVARNDANEAINNVIELANKIQDQGSAMKLYRMIIEKLQLSKNERLLFNTQAKLARLHLERQELDKVEAMVQELVGSCKTADGRDDSRKGQMLLEAYALEIQLCVALKNNARMKQIFRRTESLTADSNDPRFMGIIRESGAKLYMSERNWSKAFSEFFESFKCYQEVGNPRAKTILKYVVFSNILCNSEINPFDSQEAKVYKEDPEIQIMIRLRDAYEQNEINELQAVLADKHFNLGQDSFISEYLGELLRSVRMSILQAKLRPYRTVKLSFLAKELNINVKEVVSLVTELILDNKVSGRIDEVQGFLEQASETASESSNKRYTAISKWVRSLHEIQASLVEKVKH
jgi:COP9 signalosome complex subunit 2